MRKVAVTYGDCFTPLGNLNRTWDGLMGGQKGIEPQTFGQFAGEYPLAVISEFHSDSGGHERCTEMLNLLCACIPALPERTHCICTTTKGGVDELIVDAGIEKAQPWEIGKEVANQLNIDTPPLMVSGACASGTIAIINGIMRIMEEECDHVLVLGFDLISNFVLSGFDSLKALSPTGAKPFDRKRDGLSLGEAGGWLLLSAVDAVKGKTDYMAGVDGWGVSCDATHITAPCRNGSGLKRVLQKVLQQKDAPVGGVNAHGTGTVYNDAMELLAFNEYLQEKTPVCSVKGSLGHSLAASGIVEALLSIKSLQHGVLPPTVGLDFAEETRCLISGIEPLELKEKSVLTTNSGFGGINAALLFTEL